MTVVGIVLTVFSGVSALLSAVGKLSGQAAIEEILDHVGVTGAVREVLPYLQIAGGAGALIGLFVLPWLGVAALAGLALYYLGAVVFHIRAGDGISGFGVPLGLTAVAAAAAIVRVITI